MIAPLALVLALHAHAICLRDHSAQVSGPITGTWVQTSGAQHVQMMPSIDTTRADAHVAAEPCRARWTHKDVAIGPAPEPWTILRCVVPPVADPVEMRGRWYLQDADRAWWASAGPGVWERIEGQP